MIRKDRLGNQKGFTLIEIIAVLLLLGILAAVAVPRYFDMQEETEVQTLKVALNDMKSRAILAYSKSLLANDGVAVATDLNGWDDLGLADTAALNASYDDFVGTWASVSGTGIDYTMNYGGQTVSFSLTAGAASTPPTIAISGP